MLDAGDSVFATLLVMALGAGEAVVVALGLGVAVWVRVVVGVGVGVLVGVGVSVGVGVAVGVGRIQSIGSRTQMSVAVWPARAAVISPVCTNLLLAGS